MKLFLFYIFSFLLIIVSNIARSQDGVIAFTYENFSSSHKPRALMVNVVIQSEEKSVSYTLPYAFKGEGVTRLKTNDNTIQENLVLSSDTIKRYVYKNLSTGVMLFEPRIDFVYKEYKVFTDSLHSMFWRITAEKKDIDSFQCIKATAFWRGRYYTAWFTEKIPVSNGPWKFGGLPGLIVEIYDSDFISYWKLKSVRQSEHFIFPATPNYNDGTFADFKVEFNKKYLKVKQSIEAHDGVNDPGCSGCKGSTVFKADTPERLTENK